MNTACNCLSLRQATRRVTQLYDQALAPLDLRATQFALLSAIERHGPIALIHWPRKWCWTGRRSATTCGR